MDPVNDFGRWWLSGPKYDHSARQYGASWLVGVEEALNWRSRTLTGARDIHDVVRAFRGREFWKRDGFYQLHDVVLPPDFLLAQGGDDCDGWAMTHAQAINHALGRFGWRAYAISYLADPWWMSHHYCAAIAPDGRVWVVQPQPTEEDWRTYGDGHPRCQTVYGPFLSIEATVPIVASWYQARVVWWDRRDGFYRPA